MTNSAPNGPKNQQFKDSCIWEALLELSSLFEVHFITLDKAFYQGNDSRQGMSEILAKEVQQIGENIEIHYGIDPFLKVVRKQTPKFDSAKIAELIREEMLKVSSDSQKKAWRQIGPILNSNIDAFLTEESKNLAIAFTIDFAVTLMDPITNSEVDGKAILYGECSLLLEHFSICNLQLESVETYKCDGTKLHRSAYVYATAHMGRRTIPYKFKYPLGKM